MDTIKVLHIPLILIGGFLSGTMVKCGEGSEEKLAGTEEPYQEWRSLQVTATAYNSLKNQGSGDFTITAWGDTLSSGTKSIAVSPDLLSKGLTYKTPVKIIGLEGIYIVNDKMHPRWRNKIDIYMGTDRQKALQWGRRKVQICFPSTTTETDQNNIGQ